MAASWPNAFDGSFPGYPYEDGVEYVLGAYANSWISAIQALETGVGYGTSGPSSPLNSPTYGQFTSLAARIAALEVVLKTAIQPGTLNTAAGNIAPVASAAAAGVVQLGARADHIHEGVTSFMTRPGEVTLVPADICSVFTGIGQLFVSTGAGEGVLFAMGPPNSVLQVNAAGNGLVWAPAPFQSGDAKFTTAATIESGWIAADSSQFSTTNPTYEALFNATGYAYNLPGDPSSGLFRVIDLRGRVPVGTGGTGTNGSPSFAAGTYTVGEQLHDLVVGELTQHTHGLNDEGHAHPVTDTNATELGEPGTHIHGLGGQVVLKVGSSTLYIVPNGGPGAQPVSYSGFESVSDTESTPHYHFPTTNTDETGITLDETGSSEGHNNMQPFSVGQWIVKL